MTTASIVILIFNSLLPLTSIYLTKLLIDAISKGISAVDKDAAFQPVLWLVILTAGVAIFSSILKLVTTLVNEAQSQVFSNYMSDIIHAKSIEIDLEYFEKSDYYDTFHRAQTDAISRPPQTLKTIIKLGQNGLSILFLSGLLASLNWLVILILVLAALPGTIIRLKYAGIVYQWQYDKTLTERKANYFHSLLTFHLFAKEIRLFKLGNLFARRFNRLRKQLYRERIKLSAQNLLRQSVGNISTNLASFGVYGFIAYRTVQGELTLGDLVMYTQAFRQLQGAFDSFLGTFGGLYSNHLYLSNVYEFLDLKPKITTPPYPTPIPHPLQKGIVFNHVSFNYDQSSRQAIKDVSLYVNPGEVIALVGENGSGKTTLIKLLCRLYDPTEGNITFDGIDLRQFSVDELRQEISVIFQDYAQYQLTAQENIWLGNIEASPDLDQIINAARQAGIDEVISQLPQGYDTMLGKMFKDGEELSIGQWQKMALARAFLRESQLIVLDEPTSALDPKAEYEVFKRFRQLLKGQSAILITHRLSTVRMADRIYVLEKGRIVEGGTHEELVKECGIYANFFENQAQYYR